MKNKTTFFSLLLLFTLTFIQFLQCEQELTLLSSMKLVDAAGEPYSGDQTTLEGSGIIYRNETETFYVVCDNIEKKVIDIDTALDAGSYEDLSMIFADKEEYEGITFDSDSETYFLVTEDVEIGKDLYRGRILSFDTNFNLLSRDEINFDFTETNNGFEGIAAARKNGEQYLLVICEMSSCLAKGEGPSGNGTILVLKYEGGVLGQGKWNVEATIKLPSKTADFSDYSGLDLFQRRLAVVSQEDSKLWIGELELATWKIVGGDDAGGKGEVYSFPLDKDGEIQFCNVEGVSFIDANTIAVTTDENNDSPCDEYSESIATFSIPSSKLN